MSKRLFAQNLVLLKRANGNVLALKLQNRALNFVTLGSQINVDSLEKGFIDSQSKISQITNILKVSQISQENMILY